MLWEVHLLLGRAVGGRSAGKGVQVVVYGSMAQEDVRVAPSLRKFTFEAALEVREVFEGRRPLLAAESVICLGFSRAYYEIFDHHPGVSKKPRQSAIGEDRGRELEGKWRSHRTKEVNLWFVSNVTRSLYQPRIQLWLAFTLSPPPSLSNMDPAAVAQIAQMGLDLFVPSLY